MTTAYCVCGVKLISFSCSLGTFGRMKLKMCDTEISLLFVLLHKTITTWYAVGLDGCLIFNDKRAYAFCVFSLLLKNCNSVV